MSEKKEVDTSTKSKSSMVQNLGRNVTTIKKKGE